MKKTTRFLVPLLLVIVIFASIFWYLFDYDRAFTRDTLLSQARFNDLHGNSRLSSWFYNLAYSFSNHDENVAVELANQYKDQGNFTKAEYTLTVAINNEPSAELYENLCKTFVQQNKLLDAVKMLENIPDSAIKAELDAARPAAPVADHAAGFYSKYMDIHLYAAPDTTIYYTTDGTYPSTQGPSYAGPITLPAGETTLYAITVDKNGLVSPLTVLGYTVTGVIEEVTFVDPAMEAAIREAIGARESRTIYTNDLWPITEFTVPAEAASYEDLALLPYLLKLTIQDQAMPSLAPLATLTGLTTLDLSGTSFPVDDLSILATLPYLASLNLSNCDISTIAGLEGAPSLSLLDLSNNTVRNLEVLEPMTNLTELYLQHNAVRELTSLTGLSKLSKLNVSYNALTSLKPLSSCAALTWLEADNNQLETLEGVNLLGNLIHLSANSNALTGVSILSGSTGLEYLSISHNQVADITSLSGLTKLTSFNFSNNQVEALPDWPRECALTTIDGSNNAIASLDVLRKMESLTHVYMDYNKITNIDALADNYCLVQVNVFGNEIEDVSKLRDHDIIVNYDPT
ncbi:MAG: leucine-rich repeat domain-containing protein [Eubacteriales bacterium]|nr:leucine-rich repeat domain-containing protein [Eubacteriales bacterium]